MTIFVDPGDLARRAQLLASDRCRAVRDLSRRDREIVDVLAEAHASRAAREQERPVQLVWDPVRRRCVPDPSGARWPPVILDDEVHLWWYDRASRSCRRRRGRPRSIETKTAARLRGLGLKLDEIAQLLIASGFDAEGKTRRRSARSRVSMRVLRASERNLNQTRG